MDKLTRLLGSVAVAFGLTAAAIPSHAEEYSGLASFNYAAGAGPRSIALQGGSFGTTVYEDKDQACTGGTTDFASLRRSVVEAASEWVRVSYKDCKEGFALICVDPDINGTQPPKMCASVATQAPAGPEITATYSGAVTFWVADDAESLGFTGNVFSVTLAADPKNTCKGKDNFPAVVKFMKTLKEDAQVRITYKDCAVGNALVCVDRGLAGSFAPKVCGSFVVNSGEQGN